MHRRVGHSAVLRRFLVGLGTLALVAPLEFGVVIPVMPAYAASTITVTTTADELNTNGNCSLREAIQAANRDTRVDACAAGSGDDTIILPAGTYALTIGGEFEDAGLTGDLDITASLTLKGAGASSTSIDGGGSRGGFLVHGVLQVFGPATNVTISGVTIQNGNLASELGDRSSGGLSNGGGATEELGAGTVTVIDSVIRNNAGLNGGIENNGGGTMTLRNTSVIGNRARFHAGGILNGNGGRLTIVNSTISGNSANGSGGGIENAGQLTVINSTISGNLAIANAGGIENAGQLTVINSTISGNTAEVAAGIVNTAFGDGSVVLNNSTLSDAGR
jgi:CSLREA domain-containing protein